MFAPDAGERLRLVDDLLGGIADHPIASIDWVQPGVLRRGFMLGDVARRCGLSGAAEVCQLLAKRPPPPRPALRGGVAPSQV